MITGASLSDSYDVVIAGGGMVGMSLALSLSVRTGHRCRVLLVERFPLAVTQPHPEPVYSPSFDARSTALSYGSRLILESIGVWPVLQRHIAAIDSIHVSQRGSFGSTLLDRSLVAWPALGYVVENPWLGASLVAALSHHDNIQLVTSSTVSDVIFSALRPAVVVEAGEDRQQISTGLLVVADGAGSGLRSRLGITPMAKDYRQASLIANVSFTRPHAGRAYERFTERGPLALLPLPDSESGEPRAALVLSVSPEQAGQLVEMEDGAFLKSLNTWFGNRLGEFVRVGSRQVYPLQRITAQEQIRSGVVVMGNAAHALHPVAGQGFNLALRDCDRLSQVLAVAFDQNQPMGELVVLEQYLREQTADQQKTITFSDRLPDLFASRRWPLSLLRSLGLSALDILPAAKSEFIHHTAGMFDGAARGGGQ